MGMRSRVGAALLALFLAGCSAAQAQPGTTFSVKETKPAAVQGVPPQISPMALQFLSAKVGFMAVAESAWSDGSQAPVLARLLLATADGGRAWTRHELPKGVSVTGIDFLDAQRGFLVGKTKDRAELWATADGGSTWRLCVSQHLIPKPYRESLDTVAVKASGHGHALLDGILYRTVDSGQTWQAASLPARANDVLFLSPTVGLAVSDRTIWRTADGGRDWQPVWRLPVSLFVSDTYFFTSQQIDVAFGRADPDPTGINLLAASGSSTWAVFNEGAACAMPRCSSYLVLSQDGGMHWQLKTQESSNGAYGSTGPQPVVTELAASPQGLFAVGLSGNDLSFVPPGGGAEDVFAQVATAVQISAISIDGQGGVWLASPNASLLYRSQADASFRPVWPPLAPTLGIQFVTREIGYGMALVAGRYSLLATRDGGRSWEMVHSFADTPSGFAFTGAGAGYVVATTLSMPRAILGQVLRTGDGGKTWRVVYRIGDAAGWLSRVDLQAFSADDVLQGLSLVRLSRDGGKSWRIRGSVPFSGAQAMLATWFLSPRSGWALDAQTGGLYRTVSGGAGWRKVGMLPPSSFAAIDFVNRRDGWILASGSLGRQSLLRTTDGGMHWSEEAMPQSFALLMYGPADRALSFVSPRVGYLDTNSGVYRTSDGGRSWSPAW